MMQLQGQGHGPVWASTRSAGWGTIRFMHFDLKLWRMTAGLRDRIALSARLGLLALAVGIARFAFLGRFLAGGFQGELPVLPLVGAAVAILLRGWLDHHRTMIAHRTAGQVQATLRGRLFDKIVAL